MQKILLAIIASALVVAMLPAFGTLTVFGKGQPGTCAVGSNSGCTPPGTGCGSPGTSTPPGQTGQSQSPFAPVITGGQSQSDNIISCALPTAEGLFLLLSSIHCKKNTLVIVRRIVTTSRTRTRFTSLLFKHLLSRW